MWTSAVVPFGARLNRRKSSIPRAVDQCPPALGDRLQHVSKERGGVHFARIARCAGTLNKVAVTNSQMCRPMDKSGMEDHTDAAMTQPQADPQGRQASRETIK